MTSKPAPDSKDISKPPQEFISQILRQIKSTQKQINRKVSVILSKIDDFIFKTPAKLTEPNVQAILSGTDESDYKGLLYLCGLKHRIRQGMKKSALTAIKLILKLLEESRQKDLFLSVFCDLDDEEFKMIKLANHMLNDKNNDPAPLNLAYIIHEKRPHLAVGVYILSKKAQEKFLEWEKDEKIKRQSEKAKNLVWKEEESKDVQKLQRRQSIEKLEQRKYKKKATNVFIDQNIERNLDYYLNTFTDPLELTDENEKSQEKTVIQKNRQSLSKKTKIKKLFKPKARKSELPKQLQNQEDFSKIIEKIHLDSPNFDPYVLLTTLYNDTPISYFMKLSEKLEKDKIESLSLNKNLIYYNINDYLALEKNINAIQLEHIKKESRVDQGFTLELKTSLQGLQIALSSFADPLLKKKAQTDQIRIVLALLAKYNFLIEIPSKLRSYLLLKDAKSFARIYQKNSLYLKNFAKLPIFNKISEEVSQVINNMQNTLLELISLKQKKFDNINDIIQILFSLNFSLNPIEFLLEHLLLKLLNRIEKVFSQQIFENKNFSSENINKRNTIIRKSLNNSNNSNDDNFERNMEEIFNEEGDNIKKFIALNFNMEESNSNYNSKKFDEFSNELLPQLENLFILSKNYKEGNYDYNFKENSINLKQIEDNRTAFIENILNSAFHCIFQFLREFLNRMEIFKGKEENAKKKFRRLKSDIKLFSKFLSNVESLFQKYVFTSIELASLKENAMVLFFQIITQNFIENVLLEINFENNLSLMNDFFSRLYSPFMLIVFDNLLSEFKELHNITIFTEISQSNIQLILNSLASIIKSFIILLKTRLLSDTSSDSIPLLLLTNLKFLQSHLIHDIINELFFDFTVGSDINPVVIKDVILKSITIIIEENVLELKKTFSERKIEKIFFWVLENIVNEEILNDEKFSTVVFSNDKKKIENYKLFRKNFAKEINALNVYNTFIFGLKEFEEKEIRYYMLDILNELVVIANEILEKAPVFIDELMKNLVIFVTIVFLKPFKLLNSMNNEKIKQIWLEIQFFQNMTSKFQTQYSIQNCNEIYMHLKRISKGMKEINESLKDFEVFNESEMNLKQKLIRNNKFKFQHNFQFLFLKKTES